MVNTGLRNREVCGLRWEWEVPVPELGYSAVELQNLIDAANRGYESDSRKTPALGVLKQKAAGARGSNRLMGQSNSGAPGRI